MMKSIVINNFIDNKIRTAICEKKTVAEIRSILLERIENTKKSEKMREKFREHMIFFAQKRIDDINFFISNKFELITKSKITDNSIPTQKLLNMIRLKDKLSGKNFEYEI